MVAKNYNHPSVIMYSIGNEIPEVGTPHGAAIGRELAEKIRSLDRTRYVINSVNLMLSAINLLEIPEHGNGGNIITEINGAMTNLGENLGRLTDSKLATESTREDFATVDIGGYNYATNRYEPDIERFPNRVICGSETFPKQIAENWRIIQVNNHVIGDFTWTGWDYLGEAGIGKTRYADESKPGGVYGGYPCYIAYCGDFDIIGNRRPISFYREIVFGLRKTPYIAIRYPMKHAKTILPGNWDFIDGISSWTWNGFEDKPVVVEVYADGDKIELLCNGTIVGESPLVDFKAVLPATYHPGELVAVAYRNGIELARTSLVSADEKLQLKVDVDRSEIHADDSDLAYVMISLTDPKGVINNMADRPVSVKVEGSGFLLGMGSANPESEESFHQDSFTTYDGKVLAVIRPSEAGIISVTVGAEGCNSKKVTINVV